MSGLLWPALHADPAHACRQRSLWWGSGWDGVLFPRGSLPPPMDILWTSSHSPWDPLRDIAQFEQDGVLHTLQRESPSPHTRVEASPGPGRQVSTPGPRPGSSAVGGAVRLQMCLPPTGGASSSLSPAITSAPPPQAGPPGAPRLIPCPAFPSMGPEAPGLAGTLCAVSVPRTGPSALLPEPPSLVSAPDPLAPNKAAEAQGSQGLAGWQRRGQLSHGHQASKGGQKGPRSLREAWLWVGSCPVPQFLHRGLARTGGFARPVTSPLATARPPRAVAPRPSPAQSSQMGTVMETLSLVSTPEQALLQVGRPGTCPPRVVQWPCPGRKLHPCLAVLPGVLQGPP